MKKDTLNRHLSTPWQLTETETPWNIYPRPQLKRDSFLCLNGYWNLSLLSGDTGATEDWGLIRVPFSPETTLSGVEKTLGPKDTLIYERTFTLPDGFLPDGFLPEGFAVNFQKDQSGKAATTDFRLLLHFGAVDQFAEVFVNGKPVGSHIGGYNHFTCDITAAVNLDATQDATKGATQAINTLTVRVQDPLDLNYPYGKQCKHRGGIFYTPTSGIWQTVWLEAVPKQHIEALKLTPWHDHCKITLQTNIPADTLKFLHFDDAQASAHDITFTGNEYTFQPAQPHPWTPDDPYLYRFTLEAGEDKIESYLALRSVIVGTPGSGAPDIGTLNNGIPYEGTPGSGQARILINGKPVFCSGVLDQGYFPDGLYTPAAPEAYTNDILQMKACGFNTLRKHIKVEPDFFYYECDRLGMYVFQDLPNSGRYSPLYDTALPTVGLKHLPEHKANKEQYDAFTASMEETVAQLYNFPCIIYWTVFNEGWGQHDSTKRYEQLHALDDTRVIDTCSGWFKPKQSDTESEHIYFRPVKLRYRSDRAESLSEFGGYSWAEEGHLFNPKKAFGYRSFKDKQTYQDALAALYENEVLPEVAKGLSAAIYTQVSDVEDEINGLMTYDRQILKVDPDRMKAINDRMQAVVKQDTSITTPIF